LELFNGNVTTAEAIKFKLIERENDEKLAGNLKSVYTNLAAQAHAVAEAIESILEHKDCNP
jgi:hypothetical protein